MTARLANALHWVFSGVAILLLVCAVAAIWGNADSSGFVQFVFVSLSVAALLAWLVGRLCHYVLGGDASALWERALIARTRRSPQFRKFGIGVVLLVVASVAWSILDARYREERLERQYEQQRQVEAREAAQREAAERREASVRAKAEEEKRQQAAREEQQRQEQARQAAAARQAATQAEADRKATALRDAMIDPSSSR